MTVDYRDLANWEAWEFDCPEGTWTGRLDQKAWGKSKNLILYFSDEETDARYWFSVFHLNKYHAEQGGPSFKTEAEPGDVFELTTTKTKKSGKAPPEGSPENQGRKKCRDHQMTGTDKTENYEAAIEDFAENEDCSPVDAVEHNPRCIEIAHRFGKTPAQVSKDISTATVPFNPQFPSQVFRFPEYRAGQGTGRGQRGG